MTGATANDRPRSLFVRTFEYPVGYAGNFHRHRLGQIVYPVRGIVSVDSGARHVAVGPYRAVAIPAWSSHRVSARGNASLRSIFLDPDELDIPQARSGILGISPLLHELIREAGNFDGDVTTGSVADQVLKLIGALLFQSRAALGYVELPRITHPRLAAAFENLFGGDAFPSLSAEAVAQRLALSPRQFRRLFRAHAHMSFSNWRTLARVKRAAEQIAVGQPITAVAADLAYSSSSALSTVFKRHTGLTPSEFARLQRQAE